MINAEIRNFSGLFLAIFEFFQNSSSNHQANVAVPNDLHGHSTFQVGLWSLSVDDINTMLLTTLLSAQIAEW